MKTAIICGISGQDGAYLAQLLLQKGYKVIGTSRDVISSQFIHLSTLGIKDNIELVSLALNDYKSVLNLFQQSSPDEVYNLAGQSSVGLSFEQPVETIESIQVGVLNLLESIRVLGLKTRFFNAGSSECFGESSTEEPANEESDFLPRSPYAVAKASAHWLINTYRESYNIYACTGHLFNHESPFRGKRFVTRKVITSVIKIAEGEQLTLELGNLDIIRDWGWAPEYVNAMWRMLQQEVADDFIIATGRSVSLEYFVRTVFEYFDLNLQQYLITNDIYKRPSELRCSYADPSKAKGQLGWHTQYSVEQVIEKMIEYELNIK